MVKSKRHITAQGMAIVLSLIIAFTIFPMTANADNGDAAVGKAASQDFVPGQLIVVTEQGTSKTQMKSLAKGADAQVETMSTLGDGSKAALIEVKEGSEIEAAEELESEDEVLFVQPNYIYRMEEDEIQEVENEPETNPSEPEAAADDLTTEADGPDANEPDADIEEDAGEPENEDETDYPNDPGYTKHFQDYLAPPFEDGTNAGTINAKGAWDKLAELDELGKLDETNETVVAVLDTGVIFNHVDLQETLLKDKCVAFNNGVQMGFAEDDGSNDDGGHGTQVAGILGADFNNGIGIAGVAGKRVKMFVVDVETRIEEGGSTYVEAYSIDVALGINYAVNNGAKLINMSFGAYARDYICERAMKAAWNKGALCICSAGNNSTPLVHYPGDIPYAVTVMAHELNGEATDFTNYGIDKDVSAPGRKIEVTGHLEGHPYGDNYGTSFASPIVAGSAALLLTAKPNLTPRQIKNLLYTSTGKESFSPEKEGQGFGRINANTAMENLLAEKTNPKKIVINKPSINMFKGTNTSIEYAVYPGNTNKTKATFTSSNKKIAVVDADGIVTAKAPGSATITVKCGSVSTKSKVTVKAVPYKKIDRKPYQITDTITMDDLMDVVPEKDENGMTLFEQACFSHQYRVDLEKNETIQSIMTIGDDCAVLRIKDKDGKVVAFDSEIKGGVQYATVTYTAAKAGTYTIQTLRKKPSAITETQYKLILTSDRSFCEPAVDFIGNGVMFMSWPPVENAAHYIVRKYKDKDLSEIEFERTVEDTEFSDINFDDSKANYYTVTSCVETKAGIFYNGETPFFVKLQNPMTAAGKTYKVKRKTLKKRSVYISHSKVMTVENAEGTLTYTKASGSKKITINKKTGKVKVKKGLKKGKYRVKVKVKASGNDEYDPITQTVTFWIRVR